MSHTPKTQDEIEFFQRNKEALESFFGIKLPEIKTDSATVLDDYIKYQTLFDIYDSVSDFKTNTGLDPMEVVGNGMATYVEGKIICFNEVNYDFEKDDAIELD